MSTTGKVVLGIFVVGGIVFVWSAMKPGAAAGAVPTGVDNPLPPPFPPPPAPPPLPPLGNIANPTARSGKGHF